MKDLFLASTSTLYGQEYLEYLLPELSSLFKNCKNLLFIPYARPGGISHEEYTFRVQNALKNFSLKVTGIHEHENADKAVKEADAIFTGGGNTFLLVKQLYKNEVMQPLRAAIENGTPYLGTSAGTNIAGLTMGTSNDMPIVYPPGFKTLGVVPFNINPHYLDPDVTSTHKGETRETRIREFHTINTQPVIGLREGSWLRVKNGKVCLKGELSARIFKAGQDPYEVPTETDLSDLN